MTATLAAASAFVLALVLTGLVRRYALARSVLDLPNDRSSHSAPTPRGGGMAIAAAFLVVVAVLWSLGEVPARLAAALVLGGGTVAGVGWLDDHAGLPVRFRLLAQLAAAAAAVWLVGGMPWLDWGGGPVHLGALGSVLAVVGIVWSLNLFNFMDGINGLAAGEAVVVGGAGGAMLLALHLPGLALPALTLAAAALGFLPWNWPNARIFMGDVASGLLGYIAAVLAIASENAHGVPVLSWAVLCGIFIFDATVTLVRRARHGDRVHVPHRLHAYQRAVQLGYSHGRVSAAAMGLNLLLAAGAALALARPALLLPVLAAALLLLLGAYLAVERRLPMYPRQPKPRIETQGRAERPKAAPRMAGRVSASGGRRTATPEAPPPSS